MIDHNAMPFPYSRSNDEYNGLEHYSIEDRPHPDDDDIAITPKISGSTYHPRPYFSSIRNFDAVARNNFTGMGPKGYRRLDQRISEDVCEHLCADPDVDATDIEVKVSDGVVKLSGTVADRRQKYRAEWLADAIRGVRDVVNHLHIEPLHLEADRIVIGYTVEQRVSQ